MDKLKALLLLCALFNGAFAREYRSFPDGFKFGAASATYQVEGAWNISGKGESIWDRLTHTTNMVDLGHTGDVACDSYNQYKRDVEMLVELGVEFYRFSLSWTRILPTGFANKINDDGIRYYNNLIDELLAHNITPSITIYHWDLPQTLQDLGGWPNPLMADYFADFARVVFEAFGDRVKEWVTINEPLLICVQGYGMDEMAPALNMGGIAEYLCGHTLLKAHAKAYHIYDEEFRPTQNGRISWTVSAGWFEPVNDTPEDIEASDIAIQFDVGWFCHPIFSEEGDYPKVMKERIAKKSLEQGYPVSRLPEFTADEVMYIRGTYDFFGLNYYTSYMAQMPKSVFNRSEDLYFDENDTPSFYDDISVDVYQDESWPTALSTWLKVVPWGFRKLLIWIKDTYNNPDLMILENGYSDADGLEDDERIEYLHLHFNAILDAVDEGCNITAYTAWSLMDNFEWMRGYTERFGLYHVDFEDPGRKRTPKASAMYYKDIIKNASVESANIPRKKSDFLAHILNMS